MNNFYKNLPKPFTVLAPMDGATDFAFREIISEVAKPDVLVTEFTNADALMSKGYKRTVGRLEYSEKQRPIVAQLWGTNSKKMYEAAKLVKELKFDGVDINMGCPVKAVAKKGAGSGLIKNPELAKEIILATREGAEGIPLSVKTRLGFYEVITEEWISFLLGLKLEALTVHARIALHMSNQPADWNEIKKCVELRNAISPDTILIGNGDVKDYQKALIKHEKFGVDGVMIGRGVFSNPFGFEKTPTIHPPSEYLKLLLKHSKLYSDHYGDTKNFAAMRRFFKIYVRSFRGSSKLKNELMQTNNYVEVENLVLPYIQKLTLK